jgi:hypothetical protein
MHTIKKKLIDLYVKTIHAQRPFLPPIEQLTINDTLYLVNFIHGGVNIKNEITYTNEHPPQTLTIPSTLNFYRIMASEYGTVACNSYIESSKYMSIINNFLKIQRKNTHRNNTKIIKRMIATLLKKIRDAMNDKKDGIHDATKENQIRFDKADAHVHYLKESKMISKKHCIYLTRNDSLDEINIGTPDFDMNLLHYIDFKINNDVIEFDSADIMKVIQHLKYVLFIDLSCSSGYGTNKELNNFRSLAKRIEGPSITKQMEMHLNLSPYDQNQSNQSNQSKKLKKTKKRRHSSLTKTKKSKKSKKTKKSKYASL